jgi:hypothetical protein
MDEYCPYDAHCVHALRLLGTTSPERVAQAVLSALRSDTPEIAVDPGPICLMQAFNQVAPDTCRGSRIA